MLDSHSWRGGNPATVGYVLNQLSPGHIYQVQLIPVADARACCAGRTYEPDDGQGNYTTGVSVARGDFASIVGTFVADASTQAIGWRSLGESTGNNDPGLSGIVVFRVVSPNDSDGDGLSDEWESFYDLDPDASDSDGDGTPDGAEDADMDGLVNSAEQAAGTSPVDGDSDDDGFTDGVENNSGEWDSATATGTDPMDADTDNDGLLDGVENPDLPFLDENQTGSDPNLADTDGDQFEDGLEVAEGSDPTDINDRPAVPVITLIDGLLGGDLTDPEDDGVEEATLPRPSTDGRSQF